MAFRDGARGYAERAPYDRIIVTVGVWDLAPAWRDQLVEGGRLVVPLSLRGVQRSIAFERADDHLRSVSVRDCGFMRMRGACAGPGVVTPLGPEPGLFVELDDQPAVDAEDLYTAPRRARRGRVNRGVRHRQRRMGWARPVARAT
ncbi:MAG: hypothetical protein ACRDJN_11485 [Chloroflexota bacterium]